MFGVGAVEVLALVLVGAVLVATLVSLGVLLSRRQVPTGREWLAVVAIRVAGGVAGVGAAVVLVRALDLGRGVVLAPAVTGLGVLVGVALGETVVRPRRSEGARTASLRPRRAWAYLPRPLGWSVAALTAVHLATLALTTATASPDDLGRDGRVFACTAGSFSSASGPYPGSFYSLPLLGVLALVALVAVVGARAVVLRPRGFAPDERGDDTLRARSLTVIVAAVGLAVAAAHVGIALTAASALGNAECAPGWADPTSVALLVSLPVALVVACWCVVRLLVTDRLPVADRVAP